MPRFNYTAIVANGKKNKGSINAESAFAARKQLRSRGIHATEIKQIGSAGDKKNSVKIFRKSNKNQLIDFTRQMSTLLNSGIKLTEAISVMTMQASDQKFKNALSDIRDRVITGESFTDAMKDYPDYFDIIYISMIKVGEVTGSIANSFATVAVFMEKRKKVESKMITAMIYPAVLFSFCILVIMFLTATIVPKIAEQLEANGQELPILTKIFKNIGEVLAGPWLIVIIIVCVALVYAFKKSIKTKKGAYIKDKTILSLPVLGALFKQRVVSRFASTLSTLLNSGLSMAESLKVVAQVTANVIMKDAIQKARERILAGADIATPLRESGVIDPTIAHMVTIGEKSGELEKMLKNISDDLESQTDTVIERLSAVIEPLIILFLAVMVGLIAMAIILPIMNMSDIK